MNNKNKTYIVGIMASITILIFFVVVGIVVGPMIAKYNDLKAEVTQSNLALQKAEAESTAATASLMKEKESLKNIKEVFEADEFAASDNMGMFGTMFDDVLQRIQQNGLMIRSIENQMTPDSDPLAASFANDYNVCSLKFFLVGSYSQLKTLLYELKNQFPYLIGLSKVNVLVYKENTDYVLIDLSVTLYSKKSEKQKKENQVVEKQQ